MSTVSTKNHPVVPSCQLMALSHPHSAPSVMQVTERGEGHDTQMCSGRIPELLTEWQGGAMR